MKKIILVLLVLLFFACQSDTKELSLNENSEAIKITPELFIQKLPENLIETSGLIFFDHLLWTINDSGGENKIYGFNYKGEIKREVEIKEAENIDWESLTQDKDYIYIGDFGNNNGNRKNLSIYKINKENIKESETQMVRSEKLGFNFEDQKDYNSNPQTPYDCEAMVEFKDTIYLFTKNWNDFSTTVYKSPKQNDENKLSPIEKFKVDALITGADISPDKTMLALIGYQNGIPILWLFSDILPGNFFDGHKDRYELDTIRGAQTEGICFLSKDSIAISCERNQFYEEQVFLIDLNASNR